MRVMFAIVVWCTQLSVHPTYWIVAIGNASYNFMLAALDQCQCGGGAFASGVIYITPLANGFWNLWYWTIAGMQKAPVFAICCFIFVEMSKLCFRICESLCIDIDSWPMIWDPLWYLLLYSLHLIDSFVRVFQSACSKCLLPFPKGGASHFWSSLHEVIAWAI